MNKAKMEWDGMLPTVLDVTDASAPLMENMDTTDSTAESELSDVDNDLENTNI